MCVLPARDKGDPTRSGPHKSPAAVAPTNQPAFLLRVHPRLPYWHISPQASVLRSSRKLLCMCRLGSLRGIRCLQAPLLLCFVLTLLASTEISWQAEKTLADLQQSDWMRPHLSPVVLQPYGQLPTSRASKASSTQASIVQMGEQLPESTTLPIACCTRLPCVLPRPIACSRVGTRRFTKLGTA